MTDDDARWCDYCGNPVGEDDYEQPYPNANRVYVCGALACRRDLNADARGAYEEAQERAARDVADEWGRW